MATCCEKIAISSQGSEMMLVVGIGDVHSFFGKAVTIMAVSITRLLLLLIAGLCCMQFR